MRLILKPPPGDPLRQRQGLIRHGRNGSGIQMATLRASAHQIQTGSVISDPALTGQAHQFQLSGSLPLLAAALQRLRRPAPHPKGRAAEPR